MEVSAKYAALLRQIFSMRPKKNQDLNTIKKATSLLGSPHLDMRYIHVTGTNGKGSVCWKLARTLENAGYKVDVVVMEVGIGGRLDPTNVIPPPSVAVITSVALEHTAWLGDTHEKIAREKSHIIKAKVPAVLGPCVPENIVRERAAGTQSPVFIARPPPGGTFEDENKSVVELCLQTLKTHDPFFKDLRGDAAVLDSTPPCRCEVWTADQLRTVTDLPALPHAVIFDVAHNPDAVLQFLRRVKQMYPGKRLVGLVGMAADKDAGSVGRIIASMLHSLHVVPVQHMRLMKCQDLHAALSRAAEGTQCTVRVYGEGGLAGPEEAAACRRMLAECFAEVGTPEHVVCVTGSFFIMRAMRQALGFDEPCDPPL